MSADPRSFPDSFHRLTGYSPMRWQERLFDRFVKGEIPAALDLPTGLGKTSVMAIWLIARAFAKDEALKVIPRRLVYIVDRRAVVDQATEEAEKLRDALNCDDGPESKAKHLKALDAGEREKAFTTLRDLKARLKFAGEEGALPISTLRGQYADNKQWLADPVSPAIIVGTVDMIGSRLLFEGYGISRKMRPYHAGLLGADALIVLDEAHLVPPFMNLLRAIENDSSLWPKDRTSLPPFVVLPLSATQCETSMENDGRKPFGLEEEDWGDETAATRLSAHKRLHIEPLAEKDHDKQLAEAAIALATKDGPARVVVFCNRRERKDDGSGASARGVTETIAELAKGNKKSGHEKIDIEPLELLVGARRVYEREQVARTLQRLGFISSAEPPEKPVFLVATSAGEVGVDLDADHMVCDLVPWERMVQRLGRVNRRGGANRKAEIVVFDTSGIEKDEARKALLTATRDLLKRIETNLGGNAGPAALLELRSQVGWDEIEKASTHEPLRPALTRALVDAWSMTSLETHTGRPEVVPWLRGWVKKEPQTTVVWRTYLPVRIGDGNQAIFSSKKETNEFFDAAPVHESERLETETYRVAEWFEKRADMLLQRKPPKEGGKAYHLDEASAGEVGGSSVPSQPVRKWRRDDIVALVLSPSAEYEQHLTLGNLVQDRKGRAKEDFHDKLAGKILLVDARLGGLSADGLPDEKTESVPPTADITGDWSKEAGFHVRRTTSADDENEDKCWQFEDDFILRRDTNDNPAERLVVEHFQNAPQSEDGRSISNLIQELVDHLSKAERKAAEIACKVGLSGVATETLALAAILHDEGKRAPRWQRAFRAPRQKDENGAYTTFAKTRGPIDQAVLDGYRHEFGSLAVFEPESDYARRLPSNIRKRIDDLRAQPEWFDLLLHLIAAHHGRARPVIGTRGCEDAPPTALEERARNVALRFARLQKRWGPWGLAWWESLLRSADSQASRENDAPGAEGVSGVEKH